MEKFIIDRFECEYAVLEKEEGTTIDVLKSKIPDAKEGDVVVLENGVYRVDKDETQKRKQLIEEKVKKLFGGKKP